MSALHPWMYRFGFPGFAETEWILPEGVPCDDPSYEPLPPVCACQDLRFWARDRACERKLLELHREVFGQPMTVDPAQPLSSQFEHLEEELREGRLVAWRLRVATVDSPADLPLPPPPPPPPPPPAKPSPPPPRPRQPGAPCAECPDMEIQVNQTADTIDDLVLLKCEHPAHRSKTRCRIRLKDPCIGASTRVVLVNPDGRLRFPEADDTSATLSVPSSGDWASFDISGEIASRELNDAVIEAHCNDRSGKVTATATVTVVSFDPVTVAAMPLGNYQLSSKGVFTTVSELAPAVELSAKASISPPGVDITAPQLKHLRIGLLQNVAAGDHFATTYGNPEMIEWVDGAHTAIVPTTIREIDFLVGAHYDSLTPDDAPLIEQGGTALVLPGKTATSEDTPKVVTSATKTRQANDAFGQKAGTVEYSLVNARIDIAFVLWAVVVDVAGKKSERPHDHELCVLRERTWELHADSAVKNTPQLAKESPSDHAPTMDPVMTGLSANEARISKTEEQGTTLLKR